MVAILEITVGDKVRYRVGYCDEKDQGKFFIVEKLDGDKALIYWNNLYTSTPHFFEFLDVLEKVR